ncbi:MAG: hypothetical protein ACRC42_00145 [Mycoplasma sp.]
MSNYYINYIDENKDPKLAELNLKEINISDGYHTLWIQGKYLIKTNAKLPNYSFYLDVRNDFGEILNIPLHYVKNLEKVYKNNTNTIWYYIDEYEFNFNFNLKEASLFNEYISYLEIKFEFLPMFNQIVVDDFNVDVTTEKLQGFVSDINKSKEIKYIDYKNAYNLKKGTNHIYFNEMNDKKQNYLPIDFFLNEASKAYTEVLRFNGINKQLNILSGKIRLIYLNNSKSIPIDLEIKPKLIYNPVYSININEHVIYDKEIDDIKINHNSKNIKGIYMPIDSTIKIEFEIKVEYERMLRILKGNELLYFSSKNNNELIKKINYTNEKNTLEGVYSEIQSKEIY